MAHADEQPILDPERLREVVGDDRDFLAELIELFIGDSEETTQAIERALAAGDLTQLRRDAHRLKGSSANVGAERLCADARELEAGAEKLPREELARIMGSLRVNLAATHEALNELRIIY